MFITYGQLLFSFKIGFDIVVGDKLPVSISGINTICSNYLNFCFGKLLCFVNCAFQTSSFIEIIKAYILDKANSVNLKFVDICSPFNRFGFLATFNQTDVVLCYADNSVFGQNALMEPMILLFVKGLDDLNASLVMLGKNQILMSES